MNPRLNSVPQSSTEFQDESKDTGPGTWKFVKTCLNRFNLNRLLIPMQNNPHVFLPLLAGDTIYIHHHRAGVYHFLVYMQTAQKYNTFYIHHHGGAMGTRCNLLQVPSYSMQHCLP